jgi:hypothetical protein
MINLLQHAISCDDGDHGDAKNARVESKKPAAPPCLSHRYASGGLRCLLSQSLPIKSCKAWSNSRF